MMHNVVLFGPPGSGKGTQSARIVEQFGLVYLATGDMLRSEINRKTHLGEVATTFVKKGELVPDSLVIEMLKGYVDASKDAKGFLFDGFPRTIEQAKALDVMLETMQAPIISAIFLEVERVTLIERLQNRGQEQGRVDDVDIKIIENRLLHYTQNTFPLKALYEEQKKLHVLDGARSVDEVFENIVAILSA